MGIYEKAEPLLLEVAEIRDKSLEKNTPAMPNYLNNLGELYRKMGEYEKAEPLYRRSIEIDAKALGKGHPDYAANADPCDSVLPDGRLSKPNPCIMRPWRWSPTRKAKSIPIMP